MPLTPICHNIDDGLRSWFAVKYVDDSVGTGWSVDLWNKFNAGAGVSKDVVFIVTFTVRTYVYIYIDIGNCVALCGKMILFASMEPWGQMGLHAARDEWDDRYAR